MHDVRTRIRVNGDQTISGIAPPEVPPGEHEITIIVTPASAGQPPKKPFDVNDLPVVDLGPWPKEVSLRREDIYDDDGR